MAFSELYLTPTTATVIFVIAVLAGYRYRRIWKAGGSGWQLWVSGALAAGCLLMLGFLPLRFS